MVKHAMPEIDERRPSFEWRLSDEGRAAAAVLAGKLDHLGLAHIVASTEPKAEETALIMGRVLGLDCDLDPGLVEHRREKVGFLPRDAFEDRVRDFFERPGERVFGEESADEAHDRFAAALERQRRAAGALLAVCHGTVITLWVTRRHRLEPMAFWRRLTLPSAVVIDAGADPRLVTL